MWLFFIMDFSPSLSWAWTTFGKIGSSYIYILNMSSWQKQWQNFKENSYSTSAEHHFISLHWYRISYNGLLRHHHTHSASQGTSKMVKNTGYIFFCFSFLFLGFFSLFFKVLFYLSSSLPLYTERIFISFIVLKSC